MQDVNKKWGADELFGGYTTSAAPARTPTFYRLDRIWRQSFAFSTEIPVV